MEKRYTALRIIAGIYKVMGVIFAILTVLGAAFTIFGGVSIDMGFGARTGGSGGTIIALISAVFVMIGGLLAALGIYAVGELVTLMINIEENTRYSAIILRDRLAGQPAMQPMQPMQPMMPPPMEQ